MTVAEVDPARIRGAWAGRVSGCLLGKPLEVLSFKEGVAGIAAYLDEADAAPLRDYVPLIEDTLVEQTGAACCRGRMVRAEPDDDINYTLLALLMLEDRGGELDTVDVARAWLRLLPAGTTWTAERSAYTVLMNRMADEFVNGEEPGFDLAECSDNDYNEWIGAQIRADLYGWVCPGDPARAADLARRDASLSHRGEGVHGAAFVAALGAAIPVAESMASAIELAIAEIPTDSETARAVRYGETLAGADDAVDALHAEFAGLSPVHTLNNLALVVWALSSAEGDFGAAIGNAVAAGWDTDCNGATVGGLIGLSGVPVPEQWTRPWGGRIGVDLAGIGEVRLDDVTERTVAVARSLAA